MKTLIEIFRNTPPGNRCLTLTKNVLDVVYRSSIDSELDEKKDFTTKDLDIQLHPFPFKIVEETDIDSTPSIPYHL